MQPSRRQGIVVRRKARPSVSGRVICLASFRLPVPDNQDDNREGCRHLPGKDKFFGKIAQVLWRWLRPVQIEDCCRVLVLEGDL